MRDKAPAELAAQLASWRPNLLYLCASAGPGGTLLPLRQGPAGQSGAATSGAGSIAAAPVVAATSALKEEAAASGNGSAPVDASAGASGGGDLAPALNGADADDAPGAAHEGLVDMDMEGAGSAFLQAPAPLRFPAFVRTTRVGRSAAWQLGTDSSSCKGCG